MTDEVAELHPLLDSLIRKLPGVVNVDYTHGSQELGCDFVFSRTDPIFGTHDHIAVIAKVGKLGQDFTDIERQIDESSMPRTFLGGKEKIRANEVWVVNTDNITRGAQAKIHEKYPARKITFIDDSRLIDLIDDYMPIYWTNVSIPAGDYLVALRARNEQADKSLSLFRVGDRVLYLEQDVLEFPRLEYRLEMQRRAKAPRKVKLEDLTSQSRLVLLEGGVGAGKSKLLRALVDKHTSPEVFLETHLLPIPITYTEFIADYSGDINALVDGTVPTALRSSDPALTYLVLIDALDEAKLADEDQVAALDDLVRSAKESARVRVIVTSRYLAGLDQTSALEDQIARFHLPPLTFKRIVEFIKAVCTTLNLSSRLIEDLRKSQLFKELPHSPISAILLAKLLDENPKELPSNMTELYSQYTELVLGRWDIQKGLQTLKEYEALDQVVMRIARAALDYELPRLTIDEAMTVLMEYLDPRNLDLSAHELFARLAYRCEILTIDPQTKTLAFKHRTFAEFFYAKDAHRNTTFPLDDRALSLYWMNTTFFYLGLLKDCPDLLRKITAREPQNELERWVKVVNLSNYCLAGYASPYEVIEQGLYDAFLGAARLFWEIATRKTESPLASLSHMHLFWLLQMVMRDSYSYPFFKAAMEDAALRINECDEPDEVKAVAIFLLNVAYIDIGDNETFDFLLERFKGPLPIDVSLAIRHEAKDSKSRTALVRRQIRLLKRALVDSPQARARVRDLYERPIAKPELPKPRS
jgi:hypothetical protein